MNVFKIRKQLSCSQPRAAVQNAPWAHKNFPWDTRAGSRPLKLLTFLAVPY